MKLRDLEQMVLARAATWGHSEPVLRSLTNGNIERRPAAEIKLAEAAATYRSALNVVRSKKR